MDSTGTKLTLTIVVSLLLLLAAATPLLFKKTEAHPEIPAHGDTISAPIVAFAEKNQERLLAAPMERKRECGTTSVFSAIDCQICVLFVDGVKNLIDKGSTQEDIVVFARDACKLFKIEDERVCDAIVIEFKDELFGVAKRLALTPEVACGLLLSDDCGQPSVMWNVTFPDVPKPTPKKPVPPKAGSPTLKVLHLSDIHLDPQYLAGSNAECGEPLCCRKEDGSPDPGHKGAGKYGDYRSCDVPFITVDSLFQHLASIQDQFDYVVFTGDLPPHNVWNQSRTDQLKSLQTYTQLFQKYLPHKTVFNSLGNHESAPVNSFPPPFVTGNQSETWLYNPVADAWLSWLPNTTRETIVRGGFYSVSPFPGLKIISLNMNFCNNENWWLLINDTDPAGQLQWLIGELQDAENKGIKVHILGHIHPGGGSCIKPFSWNYYRIINRYEGTIAEMFFGHSHANWYEMFYDEIFFKRPLGVLYIPGSVTTFSDLNPGYRIYELDGNYKTSSWKVLDYTNYFLNLTDVNAGGKLDWQMEYSAKAEYNMENLFPEDWNNLIYRMKANDTLFQIFHRHYSKSAPQGPCTGDCKTNLLCDLKKGRNGDPNICKDLHL